MSGRGSSRGPRKRLGPVQGVIRAEDLLQVFDAEQQDEAHGWWKAGSSHDLHIFQRKEHGSDIPVVKAHGVLRNVPTSLVFELLSDLEYRVSWDPVYEDCWLMGPIEPEDQSVSALRECITPVLREANFSLPESGSNGRLEFSAVEDLGGGMKKGTFTVLTVEENPQEVTLSMTMYPDDVIYSAVASPAPLVSPRDFVQQRMRHIIHFPASGSSSSVSSISSASTASTLTDTGSSSASASGTAITTSLLPPPSSSSSPPPSLSEAQSSSLSSTATRDVHLMIYKSLKHPEFGYCKGYVRAETLLGAYLLRSSPDGQDTSLFLMTKADVKGKIPAWVVNKFVNQGPSKWFASVQQQCSKLVKAKL